MPTSHTMTREVIPESTTLNPVSSEKVLEFCQLFIKYFESQLTQDYVNIANLPDLA